MFDYEPPFAPFQGDLVDDLSCLGVTFIPLS